MVLRLSNFEKEKNISNRNNLGDLPKLIEEGSKIKLDNITSIDKFSSWKKWVFWKLTRIMQNYYKMENDNFKQAFESWRYNALDTQNFRKRKKFLDLMIFRNKAYNEILLKAIKEWKFDRVLSDTEKHNLEILLESWILTVFDKARKDMLLEIFKYDTEGGKIWDNLYYGHLKKESEFSVLWRYPAKVFWPVSWKSYFWDIDKLRQYVSKMKESYLKSYLEWFLDLVEKEIIDSKSYLKLEENEVRSWQNKDKLTFTVPMENYYLPNFVDLEFALYLADYLPEEQKQVFSELSEKYFNTDFEMKKLVLANVDMLATWWESTFLKVLWRSFPNDANLSKQVWKVVYIAENRLKENSTRTAKLLEKLWFDVNLILHNLINRQITYAHELEHSLFLDDKPDNTILEELKATLFYYLNLYDKLSKIESNDIENLLKYILWEFTRRIPSKNNKNAKQYWLMENFILAKAMKNELIILKNNKIGFNPELKNFANFLKDLKDSLFKIKEIYQIKDDTKRHEAEIDFVGDSFEIAGKVEDFINHQLENGKNSTSR